MRRRAKPAKAKVEARLPVARKSRKSEGSDVGNLQKSLAEAREQQAATAEILRVISRSPTAIQPVLDAIAESAARLCEASDALIRRVDGNMMRVVAHIGSVPVVESAIAQPISRESVGGRSILERRTIHIHDVLEPHVCKEYPKGLWTLFQEVPYRTMLVVPLVREDTAIGTIAIRRPEVRPFTDKQIGLVTTFADQAVIAIENVRLFTETKEALEQQTATSEILRVISSSPTDTQPVFDTIAANAARLCVARDAQVLRVEGDVLRLVSAYGSPSMPPVRTISRGHAVGRAVIDRQTIHVRDMAQAVAEFPETSSPQHGVESLLAVPLLREDVAVGVIRVSRTQIQPFTEQQIALLQTFADQAGIAMENVRLFTELQEKNRALTAAHAQVTEALEQQTATAEILRAISSSPTDLQPVLRTIAASATRLCDALYSLVFRFDGETITLVADDGASSQELEVIRSAYPAAPGRRSVAAQAILERRVIAIADAQSGTEYPHVAERAKAIGYRSVVSVPMLRGDTAIGAINVVRVEALPFSDTQIELLQTFADQAVIAIENVRLFTELQQKNQALTQAHAQVSETLEQQTATAEILRVISSSPTDIQPVFDAIVARATTLCGALFSALFRFDGELLHFVAHHNFPAEAVEAFTRDFPTRLEGTTTARAILERRVVNVADVLADPTQSAKALARAQALGYRSILAVPMFREGQAIGTIAVVRPQVGGFTDKQVELLKTFADQAVIAIENVRLFTELQASNRELTTALDTQTATSDILRVISRSQTDVQPVFDAIAHSAARLCDAEVAGVFRYDGQLLHFVAHHGLTPEGAEAMDRAFPMAPSRGSAASRAVLSAGVEQVPDVRADTDYVLGAAAQAGKFRSTVGVPMVRNGVPIGSITISRTRPGLLPDAQVELLKTFADQAVIAIENVRLFKELEARTGELTRSVEKLTALGEVSRAVSSTLDIETVLDTIVSHASQLAGAAGCSIYEYDEGAEQFELRATHNDDAEFVAALRAVPLRKGEGLMGRAAEMRVPIQIPDITRPGAYQSSVRDTLIRFGYRALLSVPLLREDHIIGSLSFNRKAPGEFSPEVIDVLKTFATQSALAIQNARLFREIADKSHQLEVASQHKSEFLANMSHELRTPLNAIIGFSEVLSERMFGELNEKQAEYLKDIYASGTHLLSLINDILDLSKIEAGRMELELTDFDLPTALDSALTLVRERAERRGITLGSTVDERLGEIRADERKIRQVVLNLLSNAIKFTPEGGRIEVRAVPGDGLVEVSISDTGVGIAPEDQEAVFEEFRQVGTSAAKQEGTGLGLALCRKFVELHGGRIRVQSEVGVGSTFTFALPLTIDHRHQTGMMRDSAPRPGHPLRAEEEGRG